MAGLPSSIKYDSRDRDKHTHLLFSAALRDDSEVHHVLALWTVVESIGITLIDPFLAQTRTGDSGIPPSGLLVDLSGFGRGVCNDLGKLFLKLSFSFLGWSKVFLGG